VPIRSHRFRSRVFIAAAFGVALCPTIGAAQESNLPLHTSMPVATAMPPSLPIARDLVSANDHAEPGTAPGSDVTELSAPRLGVFLPLYLSFAGLQTLDAHSTMRALRAGGRERNPLLRELASHPAGLLALKAGVTASTIVLTEKLRSKHRVGAMVLMTALNSAYAMVVAHNYRAMP